MNHSTVRRAFSAITVAIVASLYFAVAVASAAPVAQAGTAIEIRNFAYGPANVTVPVGSTVTWTNFDQAPHTATARDGSFNTGVLQQGQAMSITMNTAGTFEYFCEIHPRMVASLTVAAAQATPAPTAAPAPTQAPAPTAAPAPTTAPAPAGPTPSVEANDQAIAGNSVTVARVVAAQDGWIVIHTNTAQNTPGPVIGQSAVKAGENRNVRVQLSQTPNAGDKLWPMLHIDAGVIGTYEFPGADTPVVVNGNVVMKQITVQAAAAAPAPAAPAGAPAALPNTGSSGPGTAALALVALVTLGLGFGLSYNLRRRSSR